MLSYSMYGMHYEFVLLYCMHGMRSNRRTLLFAVKPLSVNKMFKNSCGVIAKRNKIPTEHRPHNNKKKMYCTKF